MKIKKTTKQFLLAAVSLFMVLLIVGSILSEKIDYAKLSKLADVPRQDLMAASFGGELREWSVEDAYSLFSNEGEAVEHSSEQSNNNAIDATYPDNNDVREIFVNQHNEEVVIEAGIISYANLDFESEWMSIAAYMPSDCVYLPGNEKTEEFHDSGKYRAAINLLESKIEALNLELGEPYAVIHAKKEKIDEVIPLIEDNTGTVLKKDVDEFIYIDVPLAIGGIPYFEGFRDNHLAPAPTLIAVISADGVEHLSIWCDYVNLQPHGEMTEVLSMDDVLSKMAVGLKRMIRKSSKIALHYAVKPIDGMERYLITPCWSFYLDGTLLCDVSATDGSLFFQ